MAQILVFGDSIAYGAWDRKGGWVQRLREFLDEKNLSDLHNSDFSVYNLGTPIGDTTEDLLGIVEFETRYRSRLKNKNTEIIIIFEIGTNDADFVHSKNDFWVSQEQFEENIKKLIDIAQKFSTKIVFIEGIPVDESRVSPMPWDTDKSPKNENIQKYNQIMKQVCAKNNIHFIEIFENWTKMDYKKLLQDGVHPNTQGHKQLFETIKNFLIKNKIIKI